MISKQNNIEKLNKRIEKLGEANELFEAMGSDADKDPEAFVDNEGNPIKMRKKRTKMCDNIFTKKTYAEDGITMKTKGKYYVSTNREKHTVLDPKTQRESCLICPKGNQCSKAHTAIQLDLIPLTTTIKNLSGVVKV
jgi:hypothetical protein